MNSTTTLDLEMMAKAYFSDKIAITLGSQFMGYVLSFSSLPALLFPLPVIDPRITSYSRRGTSDSLTCRVIWDAVFIGVIFGQTLKWIPYASKDALHIRLLVVSISPSSQISQLMIRVSRY
jgi:hypothetical protein